MSKTLISGETLKTIGQVALGAMTFGAYHQFTTNKMMELNKIWDLPVIDSYGKLQGLLHLHRVVQTLLQKK
jgi:hypothetical protein